MPPQRRRPKAKAAKSTVRNLSLPAPVEASSVVANRPVEHQLDAKIVGPDLDSHLSSLETWRLDVAHRRDSGSPPVVRFGQNASNLSSDWVMITNSPQQGLADTQGISAGPLNPPELKTLNSLTPSLSMRPPELRPKPKSPMPAESQRKLERAPNSKRTSASDLDDDASLKRTRPDPRQTQPHESEDGAEDDDDESNRGSTPRVQDQNAEETVQSLSFACPYYRLNPVAHQQCLNYTLKRIRDMKQHLARRHYGPTFYCPICHRAFPSIRMRDDHIVLRICAPRSTPTSNLDGVSPTAQELLKQRVDRTVSAEEQWHAVYEILFGKPGTRCADPYIRSIVRETLGMVRAFLRTTGSKIIPRILDSHPAKDKETGSVVNILHDVFSEVEVQFDNTTETRQMARVASGRSTDSDTSTREPTPAYHGFQSEEKVATDESRFSVTTLSGRAGSRHQVSPMFKSNTFPGAYDVPYAASSSSSSDLSMSWPSHFLPLMDHRTLGIQQQFDGHNGYLVPLMHSSPLDISTPRGIAGFASHAPVFSATSTVCDTASTVATDYTWNDNDEFLTGVGGGFY